MAEFSHEHHNSPPLESTQTFWKFFLDGDMLSIEDLLSPDCRIQDSFQSGRGINGIQECIEKLKELQSKLSSNGLLKNGMDSLQLMRNQTQARFLVKGKVGFMSIVIGFAVEWQCGVITGFVLVKNANPSDFLVDNTTAPIAVAPREPNPEVEEEDGDFEFHDTVSAPPSTEVPDEPDSTTVSQESKNHDSNNKKGKGKEKEAWYPGKYWHDRKKKSSSGARKSTVQEMPLPPVSSGILSRLNELQPPFLCPKPPRMNAVVSVTVLGCTNLHSRMTRVVERPVNAYVKVEVGSKTRCTPVVKRNKNPTYDPTDTFLFTLPEAMRMSGGYVRFQIFDQNIMDEDILATKVVSLASLKCQVDDGDIPELVYPLIHNEKKLGKGLRGAVQSDSCTLRVKIAKIDLEEWWVLEELRLRDKATEERIAREKEAAKEEARRLKAEEIERALLEKGVSETSSQWEHDERVHNCRKCDAEFSMTIRKHHCRICGLVVCGKCSSNRVSLKNGEAVRACNDCYSKKHSAGRRASSTDTLSMAGSALHATASASHADHSPMPPSHQAIQISPPSAASTHVVAVQPTRSYADANREPDSDDEEDEDGETALKAIVPDASAAAAQEEEGGEEKGQRHVYDGTDTDDEDEEEACVIS